jgi:hypothetical protein
MSVRALAILPVQFKDFAGLRGGNPEFAKESPLWNDQQRTDGKAEQWAEDDGGCDDSRDQKEEPQGDQTDGDKAYPPTNDGSIAEVGRDRLMLIRASFLQCSTELVVVHRTYRR